MYFPINASAVELFGSLFNNQKEELTKESCDWRQVIINNFLFISLYQDTQYMKGKMITGVLIDQK